MELFIQMVDGSPHEHPILKENLQMAFPNLDLNNLPSSFARFERIEPPVLGVYDKSQWVQYEIGEDGIVRDVWYSEEMTEQEKLDKQNLVKEEWAQGANFASWTFNESNCRFEPPVPIPGDADEVDYSWDEDSLTWNLVP